MMAWQLLWPNYDKDEIRCEDNGMMVDWINDAHTMEFQQRRSHVLITTHPEDVVQAALPDGWKFWKVIKEHPVHQDSIGEIIAPM